MKWSPPKKSASMAMSNVTAPVPVDATMQENIALKAHIKFLEEQNANLHTEIVGERNNYTYELKKLYEELTSTKLKMSTLQNQLASMQTVVEVRDTEIQFLTNRINALEQPMADFTIATELALSVDGAETLESVIIGEEENVE